MTQRRWALPGRPIGSGEEAGEVAIARLREGAGWQFDPLVVETCLRVLETA